jgi:heptosyltransferase III
MTAPTALLVVHPGALGDLVCLFPVIAALRRRFHPLGILCQGHLGAFAAAEGLVDAWFPLEAAWTASLYTGTPGPEARRRLAGFSHILCLSSHAALAVSFAAIGAARLCRVSPRPPAAERIHVRTHVARGVLACGWLGAADLGAMERRPADRPPTAGDGVLIHPGAGSPRKRWPLERFLLLAERLRSGGRRVDFLLGPADEALRPALAERGARIHRPQDLTELARRLRAAAAFIGNDSGVSHLAGWLGLRSVVIFGPSDPERWRPYGCAAAVVQPPLACRPCFETAAEPCAAPECLDNTRVEDVLQAFERVSEDDGRGRPCSPTLETS